MTQAFVGFIDGRIMALAFVVAVFSTFVTLSMVEATVRAHGPRRVLWVIAASLCASFGVWASEMICLFSMRTVVAVTLDVGGLFEAGFDVSALAIPAYLAACRQYIRIRCCFFSGLCFAAGAASALILILASLHSAYRIHYDARVLSFAVFMILAASTAAMLTERTARMHIPWRKNTLRIAGALLLGPAIVGGMAIVLSSATVTAFGTQIDMPVGSIFSSEMIAMSSLFVGAGFLAAMVLEIEARNQHERALLATSLYERERYANTALQQALLPLSLPSLPLVHFSSSYLPQSRDALVGGDWYDAFHLPDGSIALSIGDVSGHGLHAALTMGIVRQAIRSSALEERLSPSQVLRRADRILTVSDYPAIVTAAFATLHPVTLELRYAFAGHPPGLIVTSTGRASYLPYGGLPLGVQEDLLLTDGTVMLDPGGVLVLYTDGCTEYTHDAIAGERRLRETVTDVLRRRQGTFFEQPDLADIIAKQLFASIERRDDSALLCVASSSRIDEFEMFLAANPTELPVAGKAVQRFIAGIGLVESQREELLQSVEDVLQDAMIYAYPGERGRLGLSASRNHGAVTICVRDWGEWFRSPRISVESNLWKDTEKRHLRYSVQFSESGIAVNITTPLT